MDFKQFYFTQHALKAFDSCPLKFKKRYLEKIRWGEPPDENTRKQIQRGRDFHLLAQRYFIEIEQGDITANTDNELLEKWLYALKSRFVLDPEALYFPEYKLRMKTDRVNLEANFDLLVVKNGRITIWDWKTGNSSFMTGDNSKNKRLKTSLQTIVYLVVLKELGYLLLDGGIRCTDMKMCYWQPEPAAVLAEINYSDSMHETFYASLIDRIETIQKYDYTLFNKEQYRNHCRFCEFNALCNHGKVDYEAVHWEDMY